MYAVADSGTLAVVRGLGAISHNGRWVVYGDDTEVHIVSFPDLERRLQRGAGLNPRWSRNGEEIVFWRGDTVFANPYRRVAGTHKRPQNRCLSCPDDSAIFSSTTT